MLLCALFLNFNGVKAFFDLVNQILAPFYIGLVLAYIANPIMKMSEKHIFRFKVTSARKFNLKRGLSIAMAFLILLISLTIIFLLVIPQVILSCTDLASKFGGYVETTVAWLDEFLPDSIFNGANLTIENFYNTVLGFFSDSDLGAELTDISAQLDLITNNIDTVVSNTVTILQNCLPIIFDAFAGVATGFFNVILGVFFAIYTLSSKEKLIAQLKKFIRAFTSEKMYQSTLDFGHFTNNTMGSYLLGKVLDSLVVGIVMFIICAIFDIPYAPLLSVIIAITNVIPVIGPFIGAAPGVLIIFIVDPAKVLPFIIINVVVQQIDGNIIVPKILGETTGLSSLWVLFSITLFGGLWGLTGMFISVPIFAIIYMLAKKLIEKRLESKELCSDTEEYYTDKDVSVFLDAEDDNVSITAKFKEFKKRRQEKKAASNKNKHH